MTCSYLQTRQHQHTDLRLALAVSLVSTLVATVNLHAQPTGPAFRVNTTTTGVQSLAGVASAPDGAFTIVWSSFSYPSSGNSAVIGQRFDPIGNSVGGEFRVDSGLGGEAMSPAVTSDGTGNFVVVYIKNPLTNSDVFGQRFARSGSRLGQEFRVNTYTTGEQDIAAAAAALDGAFVVVWRDRNSGTKGIHGQRFVANGDPLGDQFSVVTFTATVTGSFPSIASDSSGNFVVAWDFAYSGDVFARRFASAGGPLGPEFRVNTYTTDSQGWPSIARSGNGDFIVVWANSTLDFFHPELSGQRFSAGGQPAGSEFRVNTGFVWGNPPAVASDTVGGFVVIWDTCSVYECGAGVYGQRFAPTGSPLGGQFLIGSSKGSPWPVVSMSLNGDFVVAWQTPDYDESWYPGLGVSARRFFGGVHGDVNGDGVVNVVDVLWLINYLFAEGPPPIGAADAFRDGVLDVIDILYLINHLFAGGPPPE